MNEALVDAIARAVLYEGYMLYPYRPSVKTRQRWTFGGIFPREYSDQHDQSDPGFMEAQCLLEARGAAGISVRLRFLHLVDRTVEAAPDFHRVPLLRIGDRDFPEWQEAVEREVRCEQVSLEALLANPMRQIFSFDSGRQEEMLTDGDREAGRIVRVQQGIRGMLELSARKIEGELVELTLRVTNTTPICASPEREEVQKQAFISTHMILQAHDAAFFSLTDPPAEPLSAAVAAGQCRNTGCWPVLAGDEGDADALLISPIILPDYPQIAPESPGDLFDGTEIDEILSLRIRTLTDDEKRQAAAVDEHVRRLLERTEGLARDELMNLHGTFRGVHAGPMEERDA